MKAILHSITCLVLAMPIQVAADAVESTYLERAKTIPSAGGVSGNDDLMRFEYDISGDGQPEVFLSRTSFRDGKQGYIWAVYTKSGPRGNYAEAGVVTFSPDGFWPTKWKKDSKTDGFYTYGPAGGGKGSLYFHAFENGKLREAERIEISQNHEAMSEFLANRKEIEVKKSPIKK